MASRDSAPKFTPGALNYYFIHTMLRQIATKRAPVARAFSTARPMFSESKSDSFKQREAADENVYVKQHEAEQLKKLKEKLEQQKEVVNKLEAELKGLKK